MILTEPRLWRQERGNARNNSQDACLTKYLVSLEEERQEIAEIDLLVYDLGGNGGGRTSLERKIIKSVLDMLNLVSCRIFKYRYYINIGLGAYKKDFHARDTDLGEIT